MPEHYDGPEYRTGCELRASTDDPAMTTLTVARFDAWNEIFDPREGRFLEMPARGAYAESFAQRGSSIKVLFNHGHDASLGQRALGTPHNLREGDNGPQADIAWIDRPYVDDIRGGIPPAVERSIYGVSYMFRVLDDSWDMSPERSEHNPDGIPERTLLRVDTIELGLVTFAADQGTEELVGVRSWTPPTNRESTTSEHPATAPGADRDTNRETALAFALNQRSRSASGTHHTTTKGKAQ